MLKNDIERYGSVAKFFHWLMALAIIGMLALGLYMEDLEISPDKLKLYGIHKSIGVLILIFASLRLVWKNINIIPKLPDSIPALQKLAAGISHYALYATMFLMPLSGWLMSSAAGFQVSVFGIFKLPNLINKDQDLRNLFSSAHTFIGYALIVLIILHALAALKHHFIDKDNILRRMLP